jgi:hypothetical protein
MNRFSEPADKAELIEIAKTSKNPVTDLYNYWLWRSRLWEQDNKPRSTDYIHASAIGYCTRKTALEMCDLLDYSMEDWVDLLRIFECGQGLHNRVQRALGELGVVYDMEKMTINAEYRIGGSIDGKYKHRGEEEIFEIKSINTFSFSRSELPLKQHKMQACVYMLSEEIWKTRFFYEDKNTQKVKEIIYPMDDAVLEKTLERSVKLWKHIETIREAKKAGHDIVNTMLPIATCITPSEATAQNCTAREGCFEYL